VSGSCT